MEAGKIEVDPPTAVPTRTAGPSRKKPTAAPSRLPAGPRRTTAPTRSRSSPAPHDLEQMIEDVVERKMIPVNTRIDEHNARLMALEQDRREHTEVMRGLTGLIKENQKSVGGLESTMCSLNIGEFVGAVNRMQSMAARMEEREREAETMSGPHPFINGTFLFYFIFILF